MPEERISLQGTVTAVIYKNQTNGYAIFEAAVGEESVTMTGTLPLIAVGENITAIGRYVEHPTYGRQFQVESYEKSLPTTVSAIRIYLSGGAVKGVGPKTADKIIELFGERALDIIENHPEALERIKGITRAKAKSISESFREQFGIRRAMMFLQRYGVPTQVAFSAWKCWGTATEEIIKCNPFVLCEMDEGMSFEQADGVAEQMGFDKNSPFRISSALKYILLCNSYSAGHTFLPEAALVSTAASLTALAETAIEDRMQELIEDGVLIKRPIGNKTAVYSDRTYADELTCARRLREIADTVRPLGGYRDDLPGRVEKEMKISFNHEQMRAIAGAAQCGVMVLTGGPGTGKTTTLSGIIALYRMLGVRYALAAPTGRAAKRISELTGQEAKTIHRLLETQYDGKGQLRFAKNESEPLQVDAVICDEASMIPIDLMASLLRALPRGCRLILVGDENQLPPVGAGNVLGDVIGSGVIETVELKDIFRQAADSLIITNAHRILNGDEPVFKGKKRDVFFINASSAAGATDTIVDLAVRRLVKTYGYDPLSDIQVITLSKLGLCGTGNLNEHLRQAVNPPAEDKKEKTWMYRSFREGDKVIQMRNNYDIVYKLPNGEMGTGIFNGDIGLVTRIDAAAEMMEIRFDDRVASYPFACLDELDYAYAMTVHKSQGSEFRCVVLAVVDSPRNLLYRNLLYTAVTRARENLVIVADPDKIRAMIANKTKTKRFTGLKYLLSEEA